MSVFERAALRLLAWAGLDLDFAISVRDEPVSRITEALYLGVRPVPGAVAGLRDVGITHVVSCLPESERAAMAFLGDAFSTLFLPLADRMDEDIAATFPACRAFCDDAWGAGGRVFIHCEVGVSRSASQVIALLMQSEGEGFLATYQRVRRRRSRVLPNIGFAAQLQRLERELRGAGGRPGVAGEPSSLARYLKEVCNAPVEIEVLQSVLHEHDDDAVAAIEAIFGEIPRVVQGVRR